MANILITGAKGQLGSELKELFFGVEGDTLFFTDVAELDITNRESVYHFLNDKNIEVIINCAAYTAVDKAEEESEICDKVNRKAPGILADEANACGALLIHISTDYVFDGVGPTPYKESMSTNPVGVYGKTKVEGELEVMRSGANYIIIRTSWLYSVYGNNFAKTILRLSGERDSLNVVFDQIGTPTYAKDLAKVILIFIQRYTPQMKGIYHFSNEGVCSWYDFALEIVKLSGRRCKVMPVTSDKFPTKAVRPPYSVLDKGKIKELLNIDIPHWRDSLADFYRKESIASRG
ncbi:MAG: dTDP-4-dehydrorhamnose reductase [Bacteroidetes bacterium GWF2_41_61]|nr:MAG: dTDP-4-dehydrorhamnose reductase [Bacteroidetes bacterium GWF2_41_61]OFY89078.1 MAG: dTDP-4-dehydrorhamnose reductase [Bacteroidetes bacterium RIFOXYA12_FULL_40_10]